MQFIVTLTEHRILGNIFSPYLVKEPMDGANFNTYDKLTEQKMPQYEHILTPEQIQLVKYIERYNDNNLHKLFCKKKISPYDFINTLKQDFLEEHIRPYVEKQIVYCLDVLEYNPEPIYYKTLQNKIYSTEKLELIDYECETVFNFNRTDQGIQYKLTILFRDQELILTGKTGQIITNQPCCLLMDNNLFVFREIDGKKILPFFDKEYIQIPKQTEKKYFESFVRSSIAKYKVRAEGFKIEELEEKPVAIISLEKNLQGFHSLTLKFIYNKKNIFYSNRSSGIKVSCTFNDKEVMFTKTARDYEFENECISKLLSFGLINTDGPFFRPIGAKSGDENEFGPITWLNSNRKLLKNNGFDLAQSNLDKDYYLGNVELSFEVSAKLNDWFDIYAIVKFDDFEIPFVDFRGHITSGIREFVLPNNKVLILPEEWFASYSDLMNFAKSDGNNLKLSKQHFSVLNQSINKLSGNFKDKLKTLLKTGETPNEPLPSGVKGELRNYQHDGYSWMYRLYENNFGGCLADDMGLGKTLQTLTLLKRVYQEHQGSYSEDIETTSLAQLSLFDAVPEKPKIKVKTSLIVLPTSLIHNWQNEIQKFVPGLTCKPYVGQNRGVLSEIISDTDLIITSYGIIRNDLKEFEKISFLYIILDESQMIKNPGSKTYSSIIQLKSDFKLVLSGTPIENSLSDLWAQFNFINPGLLGSFPFFQREFQHPIERISDEGKRERLQQLIAPFILRRTKEQVAKDLPELSEQVIYCDMSEVQELKYEKEKSKARNMVLENINKDGLKKATMQILSSLMKLRQIANHPVLIDEDYISGSGKFDEIIRNIENLCSEGHKALIFSSFVGHLQLVSEWLTRKKIGFTTLTGKTTNREKVVNEFQTNEDCRFFLISLKAGGVGLNLTAASYVMILDPWWNPAAERQAINRAHRIGQDKNVMVYRFIAAGSLEEKIIKLQERKSELADIFVNENAFKKISEEDIMELFE